MAVELVSAFMLFHLKSLGLETSKPMDEDNLKLFIYSHYGLDVPKSLITLDM